MDIEEAKIRDDERAKLFSELTNGIHFDGDMDRHIKAAYEAREKKAPVLFSRIQKEEPQHKTATEIHLCPICQKVHMYKQNDEGYVHG